MDMRNSVMEMHCCWDRARGALWGVLAQLKPITAWIIEGAGGVRVALKIWTED